ncbi:MAG: MCP four helix bundle domain-containing protein, partial [Rhodomicrobium sp.]
MRATIKAKLAANFTILTILAATVAWLGISSLGSLNAKFGDVIQGNLSRLQAANDLRLAVADIIPWEKNMLMSTSPDEIRKNEEELLKHRTLFLKKFEALQNIATDDVRQIMAGLTPTLVKWNELQDKMRELIQQDGLMEARGLSIHEARDVKNELVRQIEGIDALESKAVNQAKDQAAAQFNNAWTLLVGAAGAAVLVSIVSGVLLSLSIGRGLRRAVTLADAVAVGDLHCDVKPAANDEIKDLISSLTRM